MANEVTRHPHRYQNERAVNYGEKRKNIINKQS